MRCPWQGSDGSTRRVKFNQHDTVKCGAAAPPWRSYISWCLLPQYWWCGTDGGSCPTTPGFTVPPSPVVKEVLFGSALPRPSLVISERQEGSVNMYLIKAAWEFHWRGGGGYYWCKPLRAQTTYGPLCTHTHTHINTDWYIYMYAPCSDATTNNKTKAR